MNIRTQLISFKLLVNHWRCREARLCIHLNTQLGLLYVYKYTQESTNNSHFPPQVLQSRNKCQSGACMLSTIFHKALMGFAWFMPHMIEFLLNDGPRTGPSALTYTSQWSDFNWRKGWKIIFVELGYLDI